LKHLKGKPVNFTESVQRFIESAYWLNESHAPSVVALQALAAELDQGVQAALIAQYGVFYRSLKKDEPKVTPVLDPIAELLQREL
jgi:hypothetical protein